MCMSCLCRTPCWRWKNTCEIRSYWWYKFYGVDFTVYASHPRTGRKQEFKGELDLYKPQAYEIYIVPWN